MRNPHRWTYILLAVLLIVGTASIFARRVRVQDSGRRQQNENQAKWRQRDEEAKRRFPTADFNDSGPEDPIKRAAHKEKQKRHNGLGLVSKNPEPDTGGGAFLPERQFDFPALPVVQSDIIVLGEVETAEAHLSEDKTNVYSEFGVRIINVLKSNISLAGSQITVERLGGYVKYPDGRRLLYRVGTGGMPAVGRKYVLFLKASLHQDFSILTGYELGEKVSPLDFSEQFETFRGYDEAAFLATLNNALQKPAQP